MTSHPRSASFGAANASDQHAPRARAVFLDRDGTLTVERDWVTKPADIELVPRAADALRLLTERGYRTILVTNQSAVARGMITEEDLSRIHAHLAAELARSGARLDAIYSCPHHPTEGVPPYRRECACRKPRSGLFARAIEEHDIDPSRSWTIGDAERDLVAGAALGVRGILVATGKGEDERRRLEKLGRAPEIHCVDVLAAAQWIAARDQVR